MSKKIIIVGAGGMGREVLQWIKDINKVSHEWDIIGFIDDNTDALDGKECDYSVIGRISDWEVKDDEYFVMGIAGPAAKEMVADSLKSRGAKFATLIHPRARIGEFNEIGEGTVIYPDASMSVNVKVGNFVTLLGSTVGHDAVIEDYVSIMGNCNINGNVRVGRSAFLGCQTVTVPGRKIGEKAYVSAGSVVMTNVRANTKVMGNPAKRFEL